MDNKLVPLEIFLPDIEPELMMCPIPVIERRLRDCLINACERANLWRWIHPEIPLVRDKVFYELTTPVEHTLIHTVMTVHKNGRSIPNIADRETEDNAHNQLPYQRGNSYAIPERGSIILGSNPRRSTELPEDPEDDQREPRNRGLEICVSLKPGRKTDEVGAVIHRDYHDLVVAGTLARAMSMKNRDWSDHQLASSYAIRYEHLLSHARSAIDRGFTTKTQKVTPRRFSI